MLRSVEVEPGPVVALIGATGRANVRSGGWMLAAASFQLQWTPLLPSVCCAPGVLSVFGVLALRLALASAGRALLRHVCDEKAAQVETRGPDDTGMAGRAARAPAEVDDKES
jgi:hypothetical protein